MRTKSSLVLIGMLFFMSSPLLFSQNEHDGWEDGSKFNNLFNIQTIDTLQGEVVSVDSLVPMKGMSYGVRLVFKTAKDTITAIIGPTWFTQCLHILIKPKDEIELSGSHVKFNGGTIMIASRIISNRIILQLRNDKGQPIWDGMRPI